MATKTVKRRALSPLDKATKAIDSVGGRIRQIRRARSITLAQLAGAAGISIGHLSELERGVTVASVKVVQDISKALGINVGSLFEMTPHDLSEGRPLVVRSGARKLLKYDGLGLRDYLLSPHLDGSLELLLCEIEPGGTSGDEPYIHQGEEAAFLLSGQLEIWIGEKHYRLREGDSFGFPSMIPHRYRNPGLTVTRIIWAITPPSF